MNWEEVIKHHKVREIYQNAHLDDLHKFHSPSLINLARKWVCSSKRPSLFLTGHVGSGKTYFMTALLRALVDRGIVWIIFIRSVDLFERLHRDFLDDSNFMRILCENELLLIDDVGVEYWNERVKKSYFSIVDYRISERLPFIFTSNFSKEKFGKEMGERVESRLRMCLEVEFPPRDLRGEIDAGLTDFLQE
jgi:DNA replication protein DnaC